MVRKPEYLKISGGLITAAFLGIFISMGKPGALASFFGLLILPILILFCPQVIFFILAIRPFLEKIINTTQIGLPINLGGIANLTLIVMAILCLGLLDKKRRIKLYFLEYLLFLFAIFICAQIYTSFNRHTTFRELFRFMAMIAIYFLSDFFISDKKSYVKYGNVFIVSAFIPLFFGFYQLFMGHGNLFVRGFDRVFAVFRHPNEYAFYLLFLTPLLFNLIQLDSKRKIYYFIMSGLILFSLFKTYTRSAWIGFVIFVLIIAFRKYKIRTLVVLVPLIASLMMIGPIQNRIMEHGNSVKPTSYTWRLNYWRKLWPEAQTILLGKGLGTSKSYIELKYYRENDIHNDYIRFLYEAGWVGTIIYWFFWIALAWNTFWWTLKDKKYSFQALTLMALILNFMFCSFFDNLQVCIASLWLLYFQAGAFRGLQSSDAE